MKDRVFSYFHVMKSFVFFVILGTQEIDLSSYGKITQTMSGEQTCYLVCGILCSAKNCHTSWSEWTGALLW
jgi:hypothetical protein